MGKNTGTGKIGLLAGNGLLPLCFAKGARDNGIEVVAIAIKDECDPSLESYVDRIHWTGLGRLGKWIKLLHKEGITEAVMCGGVTKKKMYPDILHNLPDVRTIRLWFSNGSRGDHELLGRVADEFEKEGIAIRNSVLYCPQLLTPAGVLTERTPNGKQRADIRFGWRLIKKIAAMQIGQTIAVKDGAVIAVEGMDGTDATLRRAGRIAGEGVVAIKVAKKDHDPRFDIPCVGPDTVEVLHEAGAAVLAVEAGCTLLLEREKTIDAANRANVAIIALNDGDVDEG